MRNAISDRSRSEIAATEIISNKGAPLSLPDDALWSIVIKQIAPGVRIRTQVYAPLPPGPFNEIPEEVAREIFNFAAETNSGPPR